MTSNIEKFIRSTTFIGRDKDIADIHNHLQQPDCRLLSIVGVGGIGKTRLALQSAQSISIDYPDGIWFINLQSLREPQLLPVAIADTLDLGLSSHHSPQQELAAYLEQKHMLLILDNFEQVSDGAPLLSYLLEQAPDIQIMVTSRETLNIPHEWVYPLKGLPVPSSYETADITHYPSVQLFVSRAKQVRPTFSLRDERAAVIRICQLLEGLPLALELAATWVKVLRCSEIMAEIQQNITFLRSQMRHPPAHHQSMEAVFTQTWERLSAEEQQAFKRLSVFRGGFTREAALEVADTPLDLLTALMDKCLIRRDERGRFHIHELLRQYADNQLSEVEAQAVQQVHCQYFASFLARRKRDINGSNQLKTSHEIERELDNIRAAWAYAVDNHLADELQQAAATYFYFCQIQSRFLESATACEQAAQVYEKEEKTNPLAQVLVYWGWMLIRLGRFTKADDVLQRSQTLFAETERRPVYGMGSHPLAALSILRVLQGKYTEAITLGEQLKKESVARQDLHNQAFACYGLTSAYRHRGNYDQAQRNARQAVKCCEDTGHRWFMAYCLIEWGNVAQATQDYMEAKTHYKASLRIRETFNDPEGIAVLSSHLAEIALLQHDYDKAQHLYERSLSLYRGFADKGGMANVHHGLGRVALSLGKPQQALEYFRSALGIALEIRYLPLILSIMLDVAELLLNTNHRQRAIELLHIICQHAASTAQQVKKAESLLPSLTPVGEQNNLETVAAVLHAELADFHIPTHDQQPLVDPLTPRELEVLHHLAKGDSNAAIAEKLVISVGTVKAHASRIYSKLGVSNRTEAAMKARRLSLLSE